jgi:hypothetical protein
MSARSIPTALDSLRCAEQHNVSSPRDPLVLERGCMSQIRDYATDDCPSLLVWPSRMILTGEPSERIAPWQNEDIPHPSRTQDLIEAVRPSITSVKIPTPSLIQHSKHRSWKLPSHPGSEGNDVELTGGAAIGAVRFPPLSRQNSLL